MQWTSILSELSTIITWTHMCIKQGTPTHNYPSTNLQGFYLLLQWCSHGMQPGLRAGLPLLQGGNGLLTLLNLQLQSHSLYREVIKYILNLRKSGKKLISMIRSLAGAEKWGEEYEWRGAKEKVALLLRKRVKRCGQRPSHHDEGVVFLIKAGILCST